MQVRIFQSRAQLVQMEFPILINLGQSPFQPILVSVFPLPVPPYAVIPDATVQNPGGPGENNGPGQFRMNQVNAKEKMKKRVRFRFRQDRRLEVLLSPVFENAAVPFVIKDSNRAAG
jgi:hypothetical protein